MRFLRALVPIAAMMMLFGAGDCRVGPPSPKPTPTTTPTPTPQPTPVTTCILAGEPSTPAPDQTNTLGAQVNAAMLALRPDCSVGGTCLLGDTTQQEWQAAVVGKLREMGYCAGQHTATTDEIAVAILPTDSWQGFHVFVGDDSGGPVPPGGARRTLKWSPAAFAGSWLPPGTGPLPTPAPTPAGDGCGDPAPPPAYRIGVKVHKANCANLDSTIQVKGAAYCAAVGFADGRSVCAVRVEGAPDRAACEGRLRGPAQTWTCAGAGCEVYPCAVVGNCSCGGKVNTNPAQAVVIGHGKVRTCTADGGACGEVLVP